MKLDTSLVIVYLVLYLLITKRKNANTVVFGSVYEPEDLMLLVYTSTEFSLHPVLKQNLCPQKDEKR